MTPLLASLLPAAGRILEVLIGAVLGGWLVAKANRKNSVALARDISRNQSEVDERLEGIRAQLQLTTQNSSFYAERQHIVYADLFRLLNVADGALCGQYGLRRGPDIDNMNRAELRELANVNKLAAVVTDRIVAMWDARDQEGARSELKAALRRAEQGEGVRAFTEAKNFAIVNALYLSPSIDAEAQGVIQSLASFSAEIQFPEPSRYKQRADLATQIGGRLAQLRENMRDELQGKFIKSTTSAIVKQEISN
jgi:hypothetical protein